MLHIYLVPIELSFVVCCTLLLFNTGTLYSIAVSVRNIRIRPKLSFVVQLKYRVHTHSRRKMQPRSKLTRSKKTDTGNYAVRLYCTSDFGYIYRAIGSLKRYRLMVELPQIFYYILMTCSKCQHQCGRSTICFYRCIEKAFLH